MTDGLIGWCIEWLAVCLPPICHTQWFSRLQLYRHGTHTVYDLTGQIETHAWNFLILMLLRYAQKPLNDLSRSYVMETFTAVFQLENTVGDSMPYKDVALRCSASSLQSDGLYLLYSPLTLILWVGSQVSPQALTQLFNTTAFLSLTSGEVKQTCS